MNLGQLKKHIESLGANDNTPIFYRDMNYGGADCETCSFDVGFDEESNVLLIDSKFYPELD